MFGRRIFFTMLVFLVGGSRLELARSLAAEMRRPPENDDRQAWHNFANRMLAPDERDELAALVDVAENPLNAQEVRMLSVRRLGVIGHVDGLSALARIATNPFDDIAVRLYAVNAVGGIGDTQAVQWLTNQLKGDMRLAPAVTHTLCLLGKQPTPSIPQYECRSCNNRHIINVFIICGARNGVSCILTDNVFTAEQNRLCMDASNKLLESWENLDSNRPLQFGFVSKTLNRNSPLDLSRLDLTRFGRVRELSNAGGPWPVKSEKRADWPATPLVVQLRRMPREKAKSILEGLDRMKSTTTANRSVPALPAGTDDDVTWRQFVQRQLTQNELDFFEHGVAVLDDPWQPFAARRLAAENLGKLGHVVCVGPLVARIRDWHDHQLVRIECLKSLGRIPNDLSVAGILDGLVDPRVAVESHKVLIEVLGDPLKKRAQLYEAVGTTEDEYGWNGLGYREWLELVWWDIDEWQASAELRNRNVTSSRLERCVELRKEYVKWQATTAMYRVAPIW